MKTILIFIIFLLSCSSNVVEKVHPKKKEYKIPKEISNVVIKVENHLTIDSFELMSVRFTPQGINLSKNLNEKLEGYNLDEFDKNDSVFIRAINIILLKQYLFHLKKSNQGYDLFSMQKGNTELLLNSYLCYYNLKSDSEWFNSAFPYLNLKKNEKYVNDNYLDSIIIEIDKQVSRIEQGTF